MMVGLDTKSLGGNRNNSSDGLKALETVYTMGKAIAAATRNRNSKFTTFPAAERVNRDLLEILKPVILCPHPSQQPLDNLVAAYH